MKSTTVIKLGGSALDNLDPLLDFVQRCEGESVVLIHGGGPQISDYLSRLGHQPKFTNGLRVTDDQTLEVVEMVLCGQVNKALVTALQSRGVDAVGVSGPDGGTLKAPLKAEGALGHVGDTPQVNTDLLEDLLHLGFTPVLAPLSLNQESTGHLNVNADTTAAAVAVALGATRLVFLTDVAGVLDQSGQVLTELTDVDIDSLTSDGTISVGMIPKLEAALHAVGQGVATVEIRSPEPGPGTILKKGTSSVV